MSQRIPRAASPRASAIGSLRSMRSGASLARRTRTGTAAARLGDARSAAAVESAPGDAARRRRPRAARRSRGAARRRAPRRGARAGAAGAARSVVRRTAPAACAPRGTRAAGSRGSASRRRSRSPPPAPGAPPARSRRRAPAPPRRAARTSSATPTRASSSGWRNATRGRRRRGRARPAAAVRELQADQRRGCEAPVAARAASSSAARSDPIAAAVASSITSWCGLARPSGARRPPRRPRSTPRPSAPKWRQRRRVSSDGAPSRRGVPAFHGLDDEAVAEHAPARRRDRAAPPAASAAPPAARRRTAARGRAHARRARSAAASRRLAMRGYGCLTRSSASTRRTKATSSASFSSTGRASAARNSIVSGPR